MTVYAATGPTSHLNRVTTTSLVSVVLAKLPYDEISRPTRFRSGGAHGIDSIFAQEARRLWPDVPLEFVLPVNASYNKTLVDHMVKNDPLVTQMFVPAPDPDSTVSERYLARDSALVAPPTDTLLAFPYTLIEQRRSGTWATVRRARRREINILFYPLNDPLSAFNDQLPEAR
jgi:hypothetical protein